MILDERNEFADNTAVGGSTGARVVGDVIDLRGLGGPGGLAVPLTQNVGVDGPAYLVIQASVTFDDTSGATATVQFDLVSDDAATLDGTITTHFSTGVIDPADGISAGDVLAVVALPQHADYQRYLGILATVAGEALTAGSINAFLTLDVAAYRPYPSPSQA
jgi:hypothetical protein